MDIHFTSFMYAYKDVKRRFSVDLNVKSKLNSYRKYLDAENLIDSS